MAKTDSFMRDSLQAEYRDIAGEMKSISPATSLYKKLRERREIVVKRLKEFGITVV